MAGIVSSASRFIPIPFVDDVIRDRCQRYVVAKTLVAHGAEGHWDQVRPYIDADAGCLAGCLAQVAKAPLKLLMFPIRKVVSVLTSVRGVPLEITRMVLLGRTLDRRLKNDGVPSAAEAAQMRVAFDAAFARMDLHAIKAVINDALNQIGDWKGAAIDASREVLGSPDDSKVPDLSTDAIANLPKVEADAIHVDQALHSPDVLQLFAEFDARFDSELANL
ncbi:hypothetical protein K227x_14540 [Rubripirellula lacrimiformis]|uniref:Uncharacterized protein n=2 Tax=Rubripirellula lacrimiformis TaxID=1930273 RepID=A0A517N7G0_9BACT|nr:hypothetical protein K227x_14540 [Rubripirellula lacrimiformis]